MLIEQKKREMEQKEGLKSGAWDPTPPNAPFSLCFALTLSLPLTGDQWPASGINAVRHASLAREDHRFPPQRASTSAQKPPPPPSSPYLTHAILAGFKPQSTSPGCRRPTCAETEQKSAMAGLILAQGRPDTRSKSCMHNEFRTSLLL